MNDNNQSHFNPLIAALIGGAAGALVVYFSDEKRREKITAKFEGMLEEGKEKGSDLKSRMDKSIASGRQDLAKKIRQVENQVSQTE